MRLLLAALLAVSPAALGTAPDDPVFSTRGGSSGPILAEDLRDPKVPLPAAVLGHRIGDAMTPHGDLVRYVHALEAASPRVSAVTYGTTPEGRDLPRLSV